MTGWRGSPCVEYSGAVAAPARAQRAGRGATTPACPTAQSSLNFETNVNWFPTTPKKKPFVIKCINVLYMKIAV